MMNRTWATVALLAGCLLGSLVIVALGRDTSPPAPNIVVLPNAIRPTSTTFTNRPLLGVPCTDRDGYRYRAAFCPGTP